MALVYTAGNLKNIYIYFCIPIIGDALSASYLFQLVLSITPNRPSIMLYRVTHGLNQRI